MAKTHGNHPELTPVIIVDGAADFIAFVAAAFGGVQTELYPGENGKIGHAEIQIGSALLMTCDPMPDFPVQTARLMLYVDNLDGTYARAIAAGAKGLTPPESHPEYGMATARVQDRWGNYWTLAKAL
jgi:PhnB protein